MGKFSIFILTIGLSLFANNGEEKEKNHWRYKRPDAWNKKYLTEKISFHDLEETLNILPTKDSTVLGVWMEGKGAKALVCVNGVFSFWDIYFNADTVSDVSEALGTFKLSTYHNKTVLNFYRNETLRGYYVIDKDSTLHQFDNETDSTSQLYEYEYIGSLSRIDQNKKAIQKYYASIDTLTIGWFYGEDDMLTRIFKKNGTTYVMFVSGVGLEIVIAETAKHEDGTKLSIIPWDELSSLVYGENGSYFVLSKDNSTLFVHNKLDKTLTEEKRLDDWDYNAWFVKYLFDEPGNGEPWR